VPRVVVTDILRSYGAAHREVGPSAEHHKVTCPELPGGELPPTRQRERAMKGFRSSSGAQRFLAALSGRSPHHRTYVPAATG
jgi:putative transposase